MYIPTTFFLLLLLTQTPTIISAQDCETSHRGPLYGPGTCQTYNGLCIDSVGSSVFIANGETIAIVEERIIQSIDSARKQSAGFLSAACTKLTQAFTCRGQYYPCQNDTLTGEAMPVLLCKQDCVVYWEECNAPPVYPFDTYAQTLIDAGTNVTASQAPFCNASGSFTKYPQPPDTYGGRQVGPFPTYPYGLNGVERYPTFEYQYNLSTNRLVTMQCTDLSQAALNAPDIVLPTLQCSAPLVLSGSSCVQPCPFPVLPKDELTAIGIAFYAPGIAGLVACVLVLFDVLWQVFESVSIRDLRSMFISSTGNSSNIEAGGSDSAGARQHARRTQLRATTLYAFIAAVLGIIFFAVGPAGSLVKGADVSCPATFTPGVFDTISVLQGTDYSDSICSAQRAAPFILQWLFNLILYALVKVFFVVNDRAKRTSEQFRAGVTGVLLFYCVVGPAICLGVTLGKLDGFTTNFISAQVEWSRQAAICWPRFVHLDPEQASAAEFVLIFVPYIITGVAVVGFSIASFIDLNAVKQKTKTMMGSNAPTSSSQALYQLIARLAVLGLLTLITLVILIVTSSVNVAQITLWVPAFAAWFSCEQTCPCPGKCTRCFAARDAVTAAKADPAVLGIQVFAMSSITMLVGFFFLSQSVARIQRDLRDGKKLCGQNRGGGGSKVAWQSNPSSNPEASSPNRGKVKGTATMMGSEAVGSAIGGGATSSFESPQQVAAYMGN